MNKNNQFITKAREIHGDRYDYSLVDYKNTKEKVKIICLIHGVFEKSPDKHIYSSQGCPICANQSRHQNNPKTLSQILKEFKSIHGDKYDYSLVCYKNNSIKVKIICPEHGVFEQRPLNHINGQGCPICGNKKRSISNTESKKHFISECELKHNDRYDYSLVEYVHNKEKIKIICPEHGVFEQIAHNHKFGQGCPKCSKLNLKKLKSSNSKEFIYKGSELHNNKYDYSLVDYVHSKQQVKIICPEHGVFEQIPNTHLMGCGCPSCNQSNIQNEINKFLFGNNIRFEENTRLILTPLELDFYLPDYNLAIEINGVYWHSELQGKDKNYHLNKTNLCKEKGIKLIHYTDYQLKNQFDIVKSQLNSILNINKRKIHGRKCEVREIDSKLKSKFLSKYHLQGNDKASVKLGLFYNNHLVSIMTFCKRRIAMGKKSSEEGEWELSRFCGNFNFYVIGGASKLLKYFERNYKPTKIVTYADKSRSNGDMYFKLGFKHTHNSKPNYWYFKSHYLKDKIYHRFNFRKSELSKKLEIFDPQKTEWENMKDNGWNRYWDCGNMVFEKMLI